MSLPVLVVSASLAGLALSDVTPTAPGPDETFVAGSNCILEWESDTSGTWTNMTIDLMSGSNDNMSTVTNVAEGLDGTNSSLSPYNWTCPHVDPYSSIYFYQFTNGMNHSDTTWTTRFTIASPSNTSKPPEYSQQPNGDPVPWGNGVLTFANTSESESKFASRSGTITSPTETTSSPTSSSPMTATDTASGPTGQYGTPVVRKVSSDSGDSDQGPDDDSADDDSADDDDDDEDDEDDGDDDNDDDGDDDNDDVVDKASADASSNDGYNNTGGASTDGNGDGNSASNSDSHRNQAGTDNNERQKEDSNSDGDSDNSGDSPPLNSDSRDTFTSTKTFHHPHATQNPESQAKDVSDSGDPSSDDGVDMQSSFVVTSSRTEKQPSSKATMATSTRIRDSQVTNNVPTLSMPSNSKEARIENTATNSVSSLPSPTSGDLNDSKLASAGRPRISTTMGPGWIYLLLVCLGVAPQLVGH